MPGFVTEAARLHFYQRCREHKPHIKQIIQ